MSSLSLSIAILVIAVIGTVVAVNLWQSGRLRRLSRRSRAPAPGSVEPTLGVGGADGADEFDAARGGAPAGAHNIAAKAAGAAAFTVGADGAAGPAGVPVGNGAVEHRAAIVAGGSGPAGAPGAARAEAVLRQPPLSDISDCIVELVLPGAQSGSRLLALTRPIRLAGAKPILFEGSADEGGWRPMASSGIYRRIRAGVLLANRHGPLNAMEFSEFVSLLQPLAETLEALLDTPDMAPVLERARALDEQCAELDAQVGINIDVGEALGVDELARIASSLEMSERGNNRYARLGDDGAVLFSLALGEAPNRLTFLLDVPRAPVAASPWAEMVACAQDCAEAVGGVLVDDLGRPLGEDDFAHIGTQLVQRYASLEAAGFQAGSAAALRLFN